VDNGMGIECDKCLAYANMMSNDDFREIEKREDCPVSDEEFNKKHEKDIKQ